MKRCPNDSRECAPTDSFCPDCGAELETFWKYQCPGCEHLYNTFVNFCVKCGTPQDKEL